MGNGELHSCSRYLPPHLGSLVGPNFSQLSLPCIVTKTNFNNVFPTISRSYKHCLPFGIANHNSFILSTTFKKWLWAGILYMYKVLTLSERKRRDCYRLPASRVLVMWKRKEFTVNPFSSIKHCVARLIWRKIECISLRVLCFLLY
jgi:hypothetical protein